LKIFLPTIVVPKEDARCSSLQVPLIRAQFVVIRPNECMVAVHFITILLCCTINYVIRIWPFGDVGVTFVKFFQQLIFGEGLNRLNRPSVYWTRNLQSHDPYHPYIKLYLSGYLGKNRKIISMVPSRVSHAANRSRIYASAV
jgi:hypothetical protein